MAEPQKTYIECSCKSDEHRIVLTAFEAGQEYWDSPELYLVLYLDNRGPVWRKFWRAAKYIFGVRRFSDFSDTLFTREEAEKFRDCLSAYIDNAKSHEARFSDGTR
jgi:hypothetical protein